MMEHRKALANIWDTEFAAKDAISFLKSVSKSASSQNDNDDDNGSFRSDEDTFRASVRTCRRNAIIDDNIWDSRSFAENESI